MINQEKVLRMTKMASYEEHGGRKDRAVVGYFRSDYIGKQTIISLIVITAAFLAGLGTYLLFHFSEVMGNIYSMDLVGTAKKDFDVISGGGSFVCSSYLCDIHGPLCKSEKEAAVIFGVSGLPGSGWRRGNRREEIKDDTAACNQRIHKKFLHEI